MNIEPEVFGIFVACAFMALGGIAQMMTIWKSTRRHPPIDQELYRDFATKAELRLLESKMEKLTHGTNEILITISKEIALLSGDLRTHMRAEERRGRAE